MQQERCQFCGEPFNNTNPSDDLLQLITYLKGFPSISIQTHRCSAQQKPSGTTSSAEGEIK